MEKSIYTEKQRRLCALLRDRRVDQGLTQAALAARLDVSQSFVTKYETGDRRLDLIQLEAICDALGLRLSELVAAYERP